ncbi:uncharacterized protein LOC135848377 [Planococcus citri]|uniref:uncharacterized protein LOC135848377 n=1 Tax=Planococcus citri TaxID=170843 RepID=UPI0031F7EA69
MRLKMRRDLLQLVATLLTDTGVNILHENDQWSIWRFIILFTSFLSAGLSTTAFCLINTNDFYAFANPAPYIAAATNVLNSAYLLLHYKNIISEILFEMDQNCYTYPDEHLLQIEYPWYLQESNIKLIMGVMKYAIFNVVLMVSLPVFGELVYYGRIKTFIYPFWAPWKVDSLRSELMTFVLQFTQACSAVWLNYVVSIFLFFIVIEFMRQYQRLISAVSSLEHRTLQQVVKEECFDRALRENIMHCVRHHQILHKNFERFKIWFSMLFSVELAMSFITFALALLVMINASSLGQVLNYFTVVFFIWINLLIRCLISEIFSYLNENLADTLIWDVTWYKTNKENRTLLLMFHLTACKPLRLYGLSVFEATRVTFAKLVRTTYSFFNVLNLSLKK